jgi:hypothetical protein
VILYELAGERAIADGYKRSSMIAPSGSFLPLLTETQLLSS